MVVYPEQSMWWNYRKPKPLKKGAYTFAAQNHVPVLPCFITMQDSDILGDDGFYIQEYTIHIAPAIYPDPNKSRAVNIEEMRQKNYEVWKERKKSQWWRILWMRLFSYQKNKCTYYFRENLYNEKSRNQ